MSEEDGIWFEDPSALASRAPVFEPPPEVPPRDDTHLASDATAVVCALPKPPPASDTIAVVGLPPPASDTTAAVAFDPLTASRPDALHAWVLAHDFLDHAYQGRWEMVVKMLQQNKEIKLWLINATPADRWSCLHQAAARNDFGIVKYLVAMGANAAAVNRDGQTPHEVSTDLQVTSYLEHEKIKCRLILFDLVSSVAASGANSGASSVAASSSSALKLPPPPPTTALPPPPPPTSPVIVNDSSEHPDAPWNKAKNE
jgi:hypothetical protein